MVQVFIIQNINLVITTTNVSTTLGSADSGWLVAGGLDNSNNIGDTGVIIDNCGVTIYDNGYLSAINNTITNNKQGIIMGGNNKYYKFSTFPYYNNSNITIKNCYVDVIQSNDIADVSYFGGILGGYNYNDNHQFNNINLLNNTVSITIYGNITNARQFGGVLGGFTSYILTKNDK